MRKSFIYTSLLLLILLIVLGLWVNKLFITVLLVLSPVFLLGWYDILQPWHSIKRNFPIVGRLRYVLESMGPKVYQYFIEGETNGTPINRNLRSLVYQRAKNTVDTLPFGTRELVYEEGYEWMNHSIDPLALEDIPEDIRITIGGKQCKKPYSASILNISAMSYGSLSANAILALNGGAKKGGFAHNTGEGGISRHHLNYEGDLIWQIGTGYFGCRTHEGDFDEEMFKQNAAAESVKMIELKLSQGAKPGHGGILPAKKNNAEIASIRGVKPHTQVVSPPYHKEFKGKGHRGLLEFVERLRNASGGKPVGFKMCMGNPVEFEALCDEILNSGIYPDYITIDGGEGGTGAAPLEFSNSVGMPFKEGLSTAYTILVRKGLKDEIVLGCSGKIVTGFDIFRAFALGADFCYSARAMMLAIGCIQALECNLNTCPSGVATQDPFLTQGLVVKHKIDRVSNFHKETLHSFRELLASAGLKDTKQITRDHIFRRVTLSEIKTYTDIYGKAYD
ncbi:FMN-binding glutamate synthase family protein [Marinigracilibium pacificum]|uniref:FMN-binding glutamate synthase family protein n=1 Tax=Marinigracilibium pacificum TaxID=2729599 RepID=A0A848J3W9_9BACT|nr:FMN-binding glutamate synthase family protein [Marinigracilibium pacificum]NMM50018.1 FMN-binding glutamate synthase family protein [Marinigracilibium pacificum]